MSELQITAQITQELQLKKWQTEAVIRLIDEGNTIPFIARYRKEATGAMDDETLRRFDERLRYLRALDERRKVVLASIEEQGKLTDELRAQIEAAQTAVSLEDLYRPYKPKRRTRAMIAREKGLEPLAQWLLDPAAKGNAEQKAAEYISDEKEIPDAHTALQLAEDIIAEQISDNALWRGHIRELIAHEGILTAKKKEASKKSAKASEGEQTPVNKKMAERDKVYENYYDYSEPAAKIPGHRILAINRGENENFLTVRLEAPEEKVLSYLKTVTGAGKNASTAPYLTAACEDAWSRLIESSVENEIRSDLTAGAQDGAMKVFESNLTQLLMQAPIQGKIVLGWDPAFRTGCKLAVVDGTGRVLDTAVIYPTAPQNKTAEAAKVLESLIRKYNVDLISVGNGTASRESEQFISAFIKEKHLTVRYAIVNEAGASVYSASEAGTKEFPEFDVGQRSAASIARRLQDPMAELVKIEPRAIGVGQYQHDMDQKRLDTALTGVVEDCVNHVGVDVNTASAALLSYVAGINAPIAENIVKWRDENGSFTDRRQLLKVGRLGPKAYEQCAGFLRIRGGKRALDMTGVHPESYDAAVKILKEYGFAEEDIRTDAAPMIRTAMSHVDIKKLAKDTGLGEYTLKDVLKELQQPGRDPREDAQAPVLRSDVLSMEDLKPDMILKGTVRNVVDFGAFVDIGVHQDGLVHISQLSDRFVKNPMEVVKVGDIVTVRILSVDPVKKKIALSMKGMDKAEGGNRK